jgi:hypothetical protein
MRIYLRVYGGDWFTGFAVVDITPEYLAVLAQRQLLCTAMKEEADDLLRLIFWDGSPDIYEGDPFEAGDQKAVPARLELQKCAVDVYGGIYWQWLIKHSGHEMSTESMSVEHLREIDGPSFWVSPELLECFDSEEDGISGATPYLERS